MCIRDRFTCICFGRQIQLSPTNVYYKLPQKHLPLWSKVDTCRLDLPQAVTFIWPVAWPPTDPASWPSLCPRLTQALDSSERAFVMALAFICGRGCQIEKLCTHTLYRVIFAPWDFLLCPLHQQTVSLCLKFAQIYLCFCSRIRKRKFVQSKKNSFTENKSKRGENETEAIYPCIQFTHSVNFNHNTFQSN